MARLVFFASLVFLAIFTVMAKKGENKPLHGGWARAMAKKVQDLTSTTSHQMKNLKIVTSRDKLELYVMANEYAYKMQTAIYTFNQGVPHMKNEDYKKQLSEFAASLRETIFDIQKSMYGDSVKLQDQIVDSLERYTALIDVYVNIMKEHLKSGETFMNNKLHAATDIIVWAIFKLHLQVKLFDKSTQELGKELDAGLVFIQRALGQLSHDDDASKYQLISLIKHLTQLTQEAILKLEYWLNIANKDHSFYKVVQGVVEVLSNLLDKLHVVAISADNAPSMVKKLKEIYVTGALKIKSMTEGALDEIEGEQDYIRNVIFDCLAVGNEFGVDLEIFLSKKDVHDFE